MIEQDDVDGRTHNFEFKDIIPEFRTGTDEYDEITEDIHISDYEENMFKEFSEQTRRFEKAVDRIQGEVANALYIMDNDNGNEYQHVKEAESAYSDALQTCKELMEIDEVYSTELAHGASRYLKNIREGLDSLEMMADKPATNDLAEIDEPTTP
jgi:hypothetical protein